MTLRHAPSLLVLAAAIALSAAPAQAGPAASGSAAAIKLSAAGAKQLKAQGIVLTATAPANGLRLPVGSVAISGAGRTTLTLGGGLRLRAGSRSLRLTALQLSTSALSGVAGGRRLTLLAIAGGSPKVDQAAGTVVLSGARIALTRAGAAKVKSALKLRRTPSLKALGTLSVSARPVVVAPAPVTVAPVVVPAAAASPTATPAPVATATPEPGPDCSAARFAATPAGSADWFGCDLPGASDLKSWTDYIQRPFPAVAGCVSAPGTVVAGGGAARIDAASPYDTRFPVASAVTNPDGSRTIRLQGSVTYTMSAHGIDETIGAFRIELAADGRHGTVYADGRAKPRDMTGSACATPADPYTDQHVFDLDLSAVTPVIAGGVERSIHVPATISSDSVVVGGGVYPAGRPWGSFTIAIPVGPTP